MQEVEAICQRILVISNGKIVADDKTSDIYSHTQQKMTIMVEFNKPVDEQLLRNIEGVESLAKIDGNNWLLESSLITDLREKIFNFAVKNHITVLSMQKKEKSLEEVFKELTK
jgi:ABC-2 type transport system ATP-binding protein